MSTGAARIVPMRRDPRCRRLAIVPAIAGTGDERLITLPRDPRALLVLITGAVASACRDARVRRCARSAIARRFTRPLVNASFGAANTTPIRLTALRCALATHGARRITCGPRVSLVTNIMAWRATRPRLALDTARVGHLLAYLIRRVRNEAIIAGVIRRL